MNNYIYTCISFFLLSVSSAIYAEEPDITNTGQYDTSSYDQELRKQMTNNPELAKQLEDYKRKNTTDSAPESTTTKAKEKPLDFTPSMDVADKAYKEGDMKTALKHYEALGKEGNGTASLNAGLIYGEGMGDIKQDKAKSAAWFKHSGELGEPAGNNLYTKMKKNNELTPEQQAESDKLIPDLSRNAKSNNIKAIENTASILQSLEKSAFPGKKYNNPTTQGGFDNSLQFNITSSDIGESYKPDRSTHGDFSYSPKRGIFKHYLPARE